MLEDSFESLLQADEVHDVSTPTGRLKRLAYKCRGMTCPAVVLMIPFLMLVIFYGLGVWDLAPLADSQDTDQLQLKNMSGNSNYSKLSLRNGLLEIHGDPSAPLHQTQVPGSTNYFQIFENFPGLATVMAELGVNATSSVHTMEVKWFKLNGPAFSAEIGRFPSLERLRLDNVSIIDFFQPTLLPHLKEFQLNQILEDPQSYSDEYKAQNFYNVSKDVTFKLLDSTFFFMGNQFTDFNNELSLTSVNVSVSQGGSILFKKDAGRKEITLSLRTCLPILSNYSYERLTLGNCNDLKEDSIPISTKFLSIYLLHKDSVSSDLLAGMLGRLIHLEELYLELPWEGLELDLASLPAALRLLSVSSMKIGINSNDIPSFNRLSAYYFGSSNQYRFVNAAGNGSQTELSPLFLQNFNKIFPKLREAAVFELHNGRYSYIETLLNSSATIITVQGFSREKPSDEEHRDEIEKLLATTEVSPSSQFFELRKIGAGLKGRDLEYDEQILLRYQMLGWFGIDSWNKYVYVRALIDNGFFLG